MCLRSTPKFFSRVISSSVPLWSRIEKKRCFAEECQSSVIAIDSIKRYGLKKVRIFVVYEEAGVDDFAKMASVDKKAYVLIAPISL